MIMLRKIKAQAKKIVFIWDCSSYLNEMYSQLGMET